MASSALPQDLDILVLTDPRHQGRRALALPFQTATVVEAEGSTLPQVDGDYDCVVVDLDLVDADRLTAIVGWAGPALRARGSVIVLADRDRSAAQAGAYPRLRRLVAAQIHDRHRSEQTLLDQLEALAITLAQERSRPAPAATTDRSGPDWVRRHAPRWMVRAGRPAVAFLRRTRRRLRG